MILFNIFSMLLTDLRPVIDPDSKIAFSLFGISIAWYAVIILSGALIATIYGYYRFGKPLGLSSDTVFTGLVLGLLFGIIGARLYYVIFTASSGEIHYDSIMDIINPRNGGLAIHGGIIAAAIFLFVYCRKKHIKLIYLLEIAMPLILFAQVVGRWGNFINQEAFGGLVKVDALKTMEPLTNATILPDSILIAQREALSKLLVPEFVINRMYIQSSSATGFICAGYYYPTFYFESIANLIGIVIYMIIRKYWKKVLVGDGISFYLIWYGIVRLFIELMRTDPLMLGKTGIRVAVLTSIIYIILGFVFLIVRRILKYKMISCKEALYDSNSSIMEEGFETPKEPFIFKKIVDFFKRKNSEEDNSQEDEE